MSTVTAEPATASKATKSPRKPRASKSKAETKPRKAKKESPQQQEQTGESRIQQGQRLNELIAQHSPISVDKLVEMTGYTKSRVTGHVNFFSKRESTKAGALTVDKRGVVKLVGEPIRRRNRSA